MSEAAVDKPKVNYYNAKSGIMSWLTTTDHKRLGIMYLYSLGVFFAFAVFMAFLLRLELFTPEIDVLTFGGAQAGDLYNRILTLHGIVMVFLFIVPGLPAVFGNFCLPIMIGAEDVFFPRINLLSWYCYVLGGLFAIFSIALGGPDTGWTFYVPYSTTTGHNVYVPVLAAFIVGWSSILTGLNFVTTVHRLRNKNMSWFKMPLFVWSLYATGWVQIIATPVIGILLLLVMMEKVFGIPVFDPRIGGDPVLFEHIFWIYSHPAVYIMILPAMGVVSEIIATFSRKTIFGYHFIAYSSIAIAAIGSLVWAHHMFTSGMANEARVIFSFLTFFVAVPSAVKVFNWIATMYKGSIRLSPPMVYTMMFILIFSIGGFTGLHLGALSVDIHLHDTAFVVAHFHYVMFGSAGIIFFAAMHYWFPKMSGKLYNEVVAHIAGVLFFIGFNATYFPLFIAGYLGMPRRYASYLPEYEFYHKFSTIGSWVMIFSMLLMFGNLIYAARKGKKSSDNPWGGATLEWHTSSPPPTLNFDKLPDDIPGSYDYPLEVVK